MNIGSNVKKTIGYLKRNGMKKTFDQVEERLLELSRQKDYEGSRKKCVAGREELKAQSRYVFQNPVKISILVPAFHTPEEFLRPMIESVLAQSYENWELCIADGSSSMLVESVVAEYDDERIRYQHLRENGGISENTNAALRMATGDWIALLDHDDFLEPDALFCICKEIERGARIVYTDEDKVDETGLHFSTPHYKEEFNYDLFLSNNYICHLFAVESAVARETGGFDSRYNGAQDYDFILKCLEQTHFTGVHHVAKVLYHWRAHQLSTAENPESKMYAYEAGRRALEDFLLRNHYKGTVSHTEHLGFYRIDYEPDTDADYLLFVDRRLKPVTPGYEEIMKSYLVRPEVGAVGGRIYGRNKRVLAAGYRKGTDGTVESMYGGMPLKYSGYMHRAALVQDVEAVSKNACLIRREAVKDLSEDLYLNSYKLFEKIRSNGYLVVMDPKVEFKQIR